MSHAWPRADRFAVLNANGSLSPSRWLHQNPKTRKRPGLYIAAKPGDAKNDDNEFEYDHNKNYEFQRPRRPDETLLFSDRIDRFEIRAVLGQGSFGRVYQAYDPLLDRKVALKVPRFGPDQAQQLERFLREARVAAGLHHPNIVAVYECGRTGDDVYIVCEYVEGKPLSERMAQRPPNSRRSAQWIRDLAKALHFAHNQGVIHRDIKPGNILVDSQGKPRLTDFGLAKRVHCGQVEADFHGPLSRDPALTSEGALLGTPAYMAPEQARGDLPNVGRHSDQYSWAL